MNALAIILSVLLVSPNTFVTEETVLFDVIHHHKVIGVLKAVKRQEGDLTFYENYTNINTSIIGKIEMTYETQVVFKGNEMVEADFVTMVNGKIRTHVETIKEGDYYKFLRDGKVNKTVERPIGFSSIMMLFQEPKGVQYAYSEETGAFFKISSSGNLIYRKLNSSGKTSTYCYGPQALQCIAIEGGLFKIEMISK